MNKLKNLFGGGGGADNTTSGDNKTATSNNNFDAPDHSLYKVRFFFSNAFFFEPRTRTTSPGSE